MWAHTHLDTYTTAHLHTLASWSITAQHHEQARCVWGMGARRKWAHVQILAHPWLAARLRCVYLPCAYMCACVCVCVCYPRYMLELLKRDLKPRDIMTYKAFENAMVLTMALGGSTNAVLHFIAMAR